MLAHRGTESTRVARRVAALAKRAPPAEGKTAEGKTAEGKKKVKKVKKVKTLARLAKPCIAPDLRRWVSLPERDPPFPPDDAQLRALPAGQESGCRRCTSCIKAALQEIDQPRNERQIPAFNPKYVQDVYPSCPCAWPWHVWLWMCKQEQRPMRCTCARLAPCIPCCQKQPNAASPHFDTARCPALSYCAFIYMLMIIALLWNWGLQENHSTTQSNPLGLNKMHWSLCKRQFSVVPENAVMAVLDENAPTHAFPAIGALTFYNASHYPEALILGNVKTQITYPEHLRHAYPYRKPNVLPPKNSWMSHATFVYAETPLKYFWGRHQNWLQFEIINVDAWTYPFADSFPEKYFVTYAMMIPLLVGGANSFSNRWIGWGGVLWCLAFYVLIRDIEAQVEEAAFCKLECMNANAAPFQLDVDTPSSIDVLVHQDGTCNDDFQSANSNVTLLENRPRGIMVSFGLDRTLDALVSNPAQPFAGCMTWRQRLTVPTSNLSVRVFDSFDGSETADLKMSLSKFEQLTQCVNESVVPRIIPLSIDCATQSSGLLIKQFKTCMVEADGAADLLSPNQMGSLVQGCLIPDVLVPSMLPEKKRSDIKDLLDHCAQQLAYCLLVKSAQQCAQQCAIDTLVDQTTGGPIPFDMADFMQCAQEQISGPLFADLKSRLRSCGEVTGADHNAISAAAEATGRCAVVSMSDLAENQCAISSHWGALKDDMLGLVAKFGSAIMGSGSRDPSLNHIVELAKSPLPVRTVPYAEAVKMNLERCQARLAGNGPEYRNDVLWPVITIYTVLFVSCSMMCMLTFVLADAVFTCMLPASKMSLRDRLCARTMRLLRYITCNLPSVFYILDACAYRLKMCLYFMCMCCDAKQPLPDSERDDEERDDEEHDREERDDHSPKKEKRYCRAMPPLLVCATIFTTIVISWLTIKMLEFCTVWHRWAMVFAHALRDLPQNIHVLNVALKADSNGTMVAENMQTWTGYVLPKNLPPPAARYVVETVISWFVRSEIVSNTDKITQGDPVWGIIFEVVFWITVVTIIANYLATIVSFASYLFQTRHLWKTVGRVSKIQKGLMRKYFDPEHGWCADSKELREHFRLLSSDGRAALVIHPRLQYQYIKYAAPFTALHVWMSVFAFYAQYFVIMASILIPVFSLVAFTVYCVYNAVQNQRTPLEGLEDALEIVCAIVTTQGVALAFAQAQKYASRCCFYSKTGGIRHPNFESLYFYATTIPYMILGLYHAYMRGVYAMISFSFRIGAVDIDLVGFGLDSTHLAFRGLLESVRIKNEFEYMCDAAMKDGRGDVHEREHQHPQRGDDASTDVESKATRTSILSRLEMTDQKKEGLMLPLLEEQAAENDGDDIRW